MPDVTSFSSVIEGVLGTRVAFRIDALDESHALHAEQTMLDEFERLEAMLSAYRPSSAWNRWRAGAVADEALPMDIRELLADVAEWCERSGGAFNPRSGALRQRWLRAVDEQRVPSHDEMLALAQSLQLPAFHIEQGHVRSTADRAQLDLHSIAKGWIVDRALDLGMRAPGVEAIVVNAGGDLARRGAGSLHVLVEDPRDAFDNSPPLVTVRLDQGGVATSSGARRPLRIGDRSFHHVIDPRTGWPVEHALSCTVIANTAASADVMATVCSVLHPDEATAFVEQQPNTGACVLTADGELHRLGTWRDD